MVLCVGQASFRTASLWFVGVVAGLWVADRSCGAVRGADDGGADAAICRDIAQLDSPHYHVRNEATRRLAGAGAPAIPHLVRALSEDSRELRFRAHELLLGHFSFDDVVPCLIQATSQPQAAVARVILRDRSLLQIEQSAESEHARKLFEFWGTDVEALGRHVVFQLGDAKSHEQIAAVVEPLLGLQEKARRFHDGLERLRSLSLPCDHRHGSGYVIARSLADGLRGNQSPLVDFAMRHLAAFETLAKELASRGDSRSSARKEISDRATMSDSAAGYLVQLLDEASPTRALLDSRIGISPEHLHDEFFRGLACVDVKECYRCVGKVHIVDMLTGILIPWSEAPDDGVVHNLVVATAATVATGDRAKALAFLDALEACRDLKQQGLSVRDGLGQLLGQRLYTAALEASDNRGYHPARVIHDRMMRLIDVGIAPNHAAFPQQLLDDYLARAAYTTSEN
ncbi:MAG: hypothetical protein FJ276_25240, partial [Planctomycetes bacterium]|nr:hypothetical protein [Planctomycetota bacterium]